MRRVVIVVLVALLPLVTGGVVFQLWRGSSLRYLAAAGPRVVFTVLAAVEALTITAFHDESSGTERRAVRRAALAGLVYAVFAFVLALGATPELHSAIVDCRRLRNDAELLSSARATVLAFPSASMSGITLRGLVKGLDDVLSHTYRYS